MAHSGIKMLLFDNMAVNMIVKNHGRTWWWIIAYTKLVYLILLHKAVFENFRIFFLQLIFIYKVGKCPKHIETESLWLLHDCRDPMES